MKIDTEHLHYWMNAVRQSPDPIRTLDAFWKGQIQSKEWLIKELTPHITNPVRVDIHGGWVGVLASLLFQSDIPVKFIYSIDIDPSCEYIATMMNKHEEIDGRFKAMTKDMCDFSSYADVIINTSCEHLTQEQYDKWLNNMPDNSLFVLQSNNYNIPEHVRISRTISEFINQSKIDISFSGSIKLPLYDRHMIIGKKCIS
jgi:hypothetical protein